MLTLDEVTAEALPFWVTGLNLLPKRPLVLEAPKLNDFQMLRDLEETDLAWMELEVMCLT